MNKTTKTKKGETMIKFIVSVLIAILIFGFACSIGSEFLRVSTQAGDSFGAFSDKIIELSKSEDIGDRRSNLLILDDKTAMVYFDQNKVTLIFFPLPSLVRPAHLAQKFEIEKPAVDQCKGSGCLCLFRDAELNRVEGKASDFILSEERPICKSINFKINLPDENCGIQVLRELHDSWQVSCEGGFMMERGIIGTESVSSFATPGARRNPFVIEKTKEGVKLIRQEE